MKKKINIQKWERNEIFSFFSEISNPFYMLTFRQDVTNLVRTCRMHDRSFYYSMIYLATKAINSVEAFRYVIEKENVYLIEERIPSFTDLRQGSELFHIVTIPVNGTIDEFAASASMKSREQKSFINYDLQQENLIYYSCTPWMEITAVTNERDLMLPGAADETIPHITWGRYHSEGERIIMEISMEVNHRTIDGYHIGRFHNILSEEINALE